MEYQLASLRQEYNGIARRLERMLEVKHDRDEELRAVTDATEEKLREVEAQKAVRLRREEELRMMREEIAQRVVAAQERQTVIERLSEDNARHEMEIKRTLDETARQTEVYQQLSRQLHNVNRTCQSRNEENDALQRRMNELMEELKHKESVLDSVSRAHRRELKLLEAATRRTAAMEGRRAEAEAACAALREELDLLNDEFGAAVRADEADERRIAAQVRELDVLHSNVLDAAEKAQQQNLWLAEQRTEAHHLEHELRSYEEQAQRQNEVIYKLTRECTGYEEHMKIATLQCARIMTEVQDREAQLAVALDEVKDVETRLHQQQMLLEAILNERKTYAKHYAQIRGSATEMARGFKLMLAQIKQLQEDVGRRERRLAIEDGGIEALVKQRRDLEAQISVLHLRTDKRACSVRQYAQEVRHLSDVFVEGEDEVGRQRRRLRDVQKERDFLDNQVYAASEELTQLYDKARVQQALLQRGESICAERLQTIDELHHRIAQLTEEVGRLKLFVQRLPELRRLVNGASRELVREQNRVQALLHECERPMNLHPNHQLASSDPEAYALTAKVNKLQRELIARRTELTEKEQRIKQQETSYLQCKATVARQLGPEIAEQITLYQGNLAKKAGQMRAMMASLKYFREQTELYQARYNELRDTLDGFAQKYVETRQRRDREARREASERNGYDETEPLRRLEQPEEYVGYIAPPRGDDHSTTAAHDAPSGDNSGGLNHEGDDERPKMEEGSGGAELAM
ncbi:flagellar associated protein [Trypanosoma rangeli]|uniref:Flagellar associated protein n=1 Tax=Trypanosoma rangeli TaxID=5698 RepID=A0A422NB26_TRYRA|nr:flagellar associated protein [Trypanosoma rangeli]RNF02626.1 flagellar associated protein [Trypanosoma rangeli]|eukprot:RNF02626.1 flagellar associated protein [Trypanosoma rangeli]